MAAINLGFEVKGEPENKREGHKAIINMKSSQALLKHLSLAYYSN
jgi:hypothetical protein